MGMVEDGRMEVDGDGGSEEITSVGKDCTKVGLGDGMVVVMGGVPSHTMAWVDLVAGTSPKMEASRVS